MFGRNLIAVLLLAALFAFSVLAAASPTADAAEDGKGIYAPGFKSSMAGFIPPPGTYGSSYKLYYSGSASGAAAVGVALDQLGPINARVNIQAEIELDAELFIEVPIALWITPHKIMGGNLGYGIFLPVGWQDASVDIDALGTLTLGGRGPFGGITLARGAHFDIDDDTFNFGDPLLTALVGWHRGNWHWNVAGLLNVPIGAYDQNDLVNMGFNRWAFDASASATWLNAQKGHEASVAAGFTFNGENPDTNYRTGTEFHVEFALMQHFSKAFAAGLTGYHYKQVTGDSGAGATLGNFKGQTTALGPNINLNFQLGRTPVSTSLRWLHEFDVRNRLEGDLVVFSATFPLGGARRGSSK